MKVRDIISEAPLPNDWDSSAYTPQKSFASRVRYATARAKKLGTGSSRIAFEIEYQGRPTVLKIAKNKKGMAQNQYEINTLGDGYVMQMNITIPMIDSDELDYDNPTWLHTEKADKMKPNAFKSFMGGMTPDELGVFVEWSNGRTHSPPNGMTVEEAQQLLEDNETLYDLMDFTGNFDIAVGDIGRIANWGVYKGRPVLIDVGGSSEVIQKFY